MYSESWPNSKASLFIWQQPHAYQNPFIETEKCINTHCILLWTILTSLRIIALPIALVSAQDNNGESYCAGRLISSWIRHMCWNVRYSIQRQNHIQAFLIGRKPRYSSTVGVKSYRPRQMLLADPSSDFSSSMGGGSLRQRAIRQYPLARTAPFDTSETFQNTGLH